MYGLLYQEKPLTAKVITNIVNHDALTKMFNPQQLHAVRRVKGTTQYVIQFIKANGKLTRWTMDRSVFKKLAEQYAINPMLKYFEDQRDPEYALQDWEETARYYWFRQCDLPYELKQKIS